MKRILFILILAGLILISACTSQPQSFNQVGRINTAINNNETLDNWTFIYIDNNNTENTLNLQFTETSSCQTEKVKAKCRAGTLKDKQQVTIEGVIQENQIIVEKIIFDYR